jgi:hypothetical protein
MNWQMQIYKSKKVLNNKVNGHKIEEVAHKMEDKSLPANIWQGIN